ncbi:MAG: S-layer homology domain-containing protein, partial [Candidatus Gracilibacteria bacterium]
MKKFICALAVMMMVLPVANASFSDVTESYDYHDAINYVEQKNLVQGYEDGTYKPNTQITRAAFTKILIGAKFTPSEIAACVPTKNFPDVASNEWYAPYVCMAKNEGIITGYQDGTFRPKSNITFAEAAKIVANTYGLEPVGEADIPAHWYVPFVDALSLQAAVPLSITDYKTPITRGEMAETIFGVETDQDYNPDDNTNNTDDTVANPDDNTTDDTVDNTDDSDTSSSTDYKTASSKSEITFSRVIDETDDSSGDLETYKLNINVKISGYLQEIDPMTSHLNTTLDRAFTFKNSNVTWDITGSHETEDDLCNNLWEVESSGSESISDLDVDTGDEKRTMTPASGWGSWAFAYANQGFYTGGPELSLEGHVLLPAVETITLTKMKPSAICGDYDNDQSVSVETIDLALDPIFPLRLSNMTAT